MNVHACRVCGYINEAEAPPWGEDGLTPTFNYCDCCGILFGYQDCSYENTKRIRRQWLRAGAPWKQPGARPAHWNVAEQLDNVSPDDESLRLAVALVRQRFPPDGTAPPDARIPSPSERAFVPPADPGPDSE